MNIDRFINVLQFLTRINIKKNVKYDSDLGCGIVYFPLVGLVIGILMWLIYKIISGFAQTGLEYIFVSICLVLFEVMITGGLHIDGFGDTFDGIFSYRSKERILEIMKDPTMGTNGILAIVFLVLFKVIILSVFINRKIGWPIVLMPVMGRYVAVLLTYKTSPAKANGMGNIFIGKCDFPSLIIATCSVSLGLLIIPILGLATISVGFMSLFSLFLLWGMAIFIELGAGKKIGGLTGDILGCGIELGELVFIMYILLVIY